MSNQIFPTLAGLTWDTTKEPEFKTITQKAVSGREVRIAFMSSPMYTFHLSYSVLRDDRNSQSPTSPKDELKTLLGFFLARQGSFDSFLFSDPSDNSIVNQTIGVGDGVNKSFQLVRTYGNGIAETINNVNIVSAVYLNGVPTTNYTVNSTGLITFNAAPSNNVFVSWSGSYYYRVRFTADVAQFNQFMYDLWELKKLDLYGSLANKV